MKLAEINWAAKPTVTSPVWRYASDGNKVVRKNMELIPVSAIGIGGCADFAISIDDWEWLNMMLWQKVGVRFIPLPRRIEKNMEYEMLRDMLTNNQYRGLDGWKKLLDETMEHGAFIKSVWLMPLTAEERVKYEQYRADYRRKQEERQEAERKAREAEAAAEEARERAELDKAVNDAVTRIKNGGTVVNKDGTLILELASRAGIKVPLRSDGWIREWLHRLDVKDGKVETVYIYPATKKTKVSDSMWNLLNKIVAAYWKGGDKE